MSQSPTGKGRFPQVRGGRRAFAHPLWPARRADSESVALKEALSAALSFRQGWDRRAE